MPDPQVVASINSLDVARFLTSSSDSSALADALGGDIVCDGSVARDLAALRAVFSGLSDGPSRTITAAAQYKQVALISEEASRWSSLFVGRELFSCVLFANSIVVLRASADSSSLTAAVLHSSASLLDAVIYKEKQLAILMPSSGEGARLCIVELGSVPFAAVTGVHVLEGMLHASRVLRRTDKLYRRMHCPRGQG